MMDMALCLVHLRLPGLYRLLHGSRPATSRHRQPFHLLMHSGRRVSLPPRHWAVNRDSYQAR